MANLLLNKSEVQKHLQVSIGYDSERFNRYIREAQEIDFKNLVCEGFYVDLLQNYTSADYQTLLNGGFYTYETDNYENIGLYKVLSYFAFARYAQDSPIVSTSHGRVIKETPYSSPVDLKQRKDDYSKYREIAVCYWQSVSNFLERNDDIYTAWADCYSSDYLNRCKPKFKNKPKITVIK